MNNEQFSNDATVAKAPVQSAVETGGNYNKNEGVSVSPEVQKDLAAAAQDQAMDGGHQAEKSIEELKNDILKYREKIKVGETRGANGDYNEKLVLENEAKLREAEKMLSAKIEESEKAEKIKILREEIAGYREKIKVGETRGANGDYNEKLVLENEAKLREAENKITELLTPSAKTEANTVEQVATPAPAAPAAKKSRFSWRKLFRLE